MQLKTESETGGVKKIFGTICPECQSTMYKDMAVDGKGRWVWYCPECGKEIAINSCAELTKEN
jgi:DNA-directed RNA polymerase subunit M/transcription elongation factor TFIIS